MKRRDFIRSTALTGTVISLTGISGISGTSQAEVTRKIFATGGGYDETTLRFLISLTGKQNPKICLLPTPVGDSETFIGKWFDIAKTLPIQPFVQKVFISSTEQTTPYEDLLLDSFRKPFTT